MKKIAYLALGSNLGDREAYLTTARELIGKHPQIEIQKMSQIYETEPWPRHEIKEGRPLEEERQNWHLNQVICIQTSLSARELLTVTQQIEADMGKAKKATWGSRVIDIDTLLYGEDIIDQPDLSIPHKHMHERQFVLVPLLEIAPDLKDPRTNKPLQEFLEVIKEKYSVTIYS